MQYWIKTSSNSDAGKPVPDYDWHKLQQKNITIIIILLIELTKFSQIIIQNYLVILNWEKCNIHIQGQIK